MIRVLFLLLSFSFALSCLAQEPSQTLRGVVRDANEQFPIIGATIELNGSGLETLGTTTDTTGTFIFEEVPVGRIQMTIRYIGYETLKIQEITLESGKEMVQEISLKQQSELLDVIVVIGRPPSSQSITSYCPSTITVEKILRYPTSFDDPVRLIATQAGVVLSNDQANNIVVRGNNPNSMVWRLEGIDIVNPNHLSNAGTFSDQVTQSGGGVNILSMQLMDDSEFLNGAFQAQYGNVLSGVMDMHLRKGNDQKREYTAQIGLIGIDLAAEGPFSKNSSASYLINYRYSTLGLLDAMGVGLGDEALNFQDLSFNLNFPSKKLGNFGFFGMAGNSTNVFEGQRDSTLREIEKDRYDIRFKNNMAAIGLTHKKMLGNLLWNSSLAFSALENERLADVIQDSINTIPLSEDRNFQSKLAFSTQAKYVVNNRQMFTAGLKITNQNYRLERLEQQQIKSISGAGILYQPYLKYKHLISHEVSLNAGLHFMYFDFNKTQSIEPRASLVYKPGTGGHSFSIAYGLHSQLQLPQLYFGQFEQENVNKNLGMNKAHHLVLGYGGRHGNLEYLTELYYQQLFNIPIAIDSTSTFSALNLIDEFASEDYVNEGTGRNYGVEVTLKNFFTKSLYFMVNASLYNSKYTAADGIERNTRFNGNFVTNVVMGKEFEWKKEGKVKTLGLNLKLVYLGGFRETPIDIAASQIAGTTIFSEDAFSQKQSNFFRPDLRVYYKRSKRKYSSMLALDIQNVSNTKNESFQYFDIEQGQIVRKYQLGIIPILSYRISF